MRASCGLRNASATATQPESVATASLHKILLVLLRGKRHSISNIYGRGEQGKQVNQQCIHCCCVSVHIKGGMGSGEVCGLGWCVGKVRVESESVVKWAATHARARARAYAALAFCLPPPPRRLTCE